MWDKRLSNRWYAPLLMLALAGCGTSAEDACTTMCEVEDPNSLRYCDQRDLGIPYLAQFKLAGMYPLMYGIQISGSWQGYPGVPTGTERQDVEYTANLNRVPDPSLNVNYIVTGLTQTSTTVPLLKPGTKYLDRWNQIDMRFSKRLNVAGLRTSLQFDIFNLLNSNSILSVVETFGTSLDRPSSILQGRLFAVGAQLNF